MANSASGDRCGRCLIADGRGFTPLEVLVAFVIMSIVLAPLLQGGSAALTNVDVGSRAETAVALARSRLSLFDALPAPAGEDLQGDESGYHWRLQVSPIASIPVPPMGRDRPDPTVLYRVAVTMSWMSGGRDSSIRLETRRLTPVPPAPQ